MDDKLKTALVWIAVSFFILGSIYMIAQEQKINELEEQVNIRWDELNCALKNGTDSCKCMAPTIGS